MRRAVVCVATTERYQRGMARFFTALSQVDPKSMGIGFGCEPKGCPSHIDIPYAFKAYALKETADDGVDLVLWCDACILPVRSMEPLWERIANDGYWICRNGWTNYEWTADSAYPDLFPEMNSPLLDRRGMEPLDAVRDVNQNIPHVVATSFGLNVRSDIGKAFLAEYFRLASETKAFCGPWTNSNQADPNGVSIQQALGDMPRMGPCGPPDVRGHRHDQSCASVIAWRLGMKLVNPPEYFAYPPEGWSPTDSLKGVDERTILLADGSYA